MSTGTKRYSYPCGWGKCTKEGIYCKLIKSKKGPKSPRYFCEEHEHEFYLKYQDPGRHNKIESLQDKIKSDINVKSFLFNLQSQCSKKIARYPKKKPASNYRSAQTSYYDQIIQEFC